MHVTVPVGGLGDEQEGAEPVGVDHRIPIGGQSQRDERRRPRLGQPLRRTVYSDSGTYAGWNVERPMTSTTRDSGGGCGIRPLSGRPTRPR